MGRRTSTSFAKDLADIMDRYVDGDQRAFSELYRRLSPLVRRQVRGKISDRDTAEDIVQAVFAKAHAARARFSPAEGADPDRAVVTWYSAIARNATIDHLRHIYRERAVTADLSTEEQEARLDGLHDAELNAEQQVIEEERQVGLAARLRGALGQLPKGQREVVAMHKLEGMNMSEISERLQVREGTLRVRAHRGYKALAELLGSFSQAASPA